MGVLDIPGGPGGLRVVGAITTIVGILYFSVIMGFVVDGIRAKMDTLKKGKSVVAEEKHTLLLGWTDKSISLIRQICLANASENGGVVVVLAETDKEELEAELASQIKKEELLGTRVIFRTGSPMLSVDLLKVSAHRAKSIIIMANSTGDADRSDATVLRTVLSLKTLPELSGHIVTELRDIDNDPLVRLVGGDDVEILVSHDVIGRLILMSARSPGLAQVYSCLLGFEGNEFYFKEWPECEGVPFGCLAERFPNAIPLGIKKQNGEVFICPNASMVVEHSDQILFLAEDDDTYKACPPASIEVGKAPVPVAKPPTQERILMCGWRRDIRDMIRLLDAVVQPGTELNMLCEESVQLRNKTLRDSGFDVNTLKNLKLVHYVGNTAVRRQLESLPWHSFTSIMILSDQALEGDIMHSDSHSLASLLLMRDLQARISSRNRVTLGEPSYCKCISEILDPRTQRTISKSNAILNLSEFIQSNELVSCLLAMISENRDVRRILDELLGPQGAYFEMEPSSRYCEPHENVSFWQLAKRAMERVGVRALITAARMLADALEKGNLSDTESVEVLVVRSFRELAKPHTATTGILLKAVRPSEAFAQSVWESWTYLADPGSHTGLVQDGLRVVGAITTIVGILYFSVIMGFVVDGIRAKMDTLKKGKSVVAEEKHTLLLGWTDKSISLIRQICLANASENGGVVVVLAETDKEELEAELASQIKKEELLGTRVIFRTGTPLLSVDLLKVSAHRAKSIVIMANSTGDADRSDAAVLRTVLSLKTLPDLAGHIVAELRDIDNDPLVRLVGGNDVEILVSHDIIGRLVLMSARSPGLARMYSCLLGFEGNEFYFKEWPECVGVPFGNLSERFPKAIPLGFKRKNGEVFICPSANLVIEKGDQILVLAEDDDTYEARPPVSIEVGKVPVAPAKPPTQERILMCGWRRDIRDMIRLLDALVQPETELHMICEEPVHLRTKILLDSGLDTATLKNLKLTHYVANTAVRRQLENLPWHSFTSIMILSDQALEEDIMHSDSHSLASLLLIRDLQSRSSRRNSIVQGTPDYCKCISEILDPRTQRTISTSTTILALSEFIQSNELVSCILAMISENRDVRVVLDELLGPQGAYFEVEPSFRYCEADEMISFWQLSKRAMMRGEILCGYQFHGKEDCMLNPEDKDRPRTWGNADMVILRNDDGDMTPHESAFVLVNSEDFERTALSRQVKETYSRQRLLESIVYDSDLSLVNELGGDVDRTAILRAVSSFCCSEADLVSVGGSADILSPPNQQISIRALISAARMLADVLEKAEASITQTAEVYEAQRH
ncbi:hypothetical protein JM18_003607 [Phytophthora kernoviae]|uniref:RCK N-terminal domain-containing protein n=2 Tax=Phytophthora kernoviae TaxID=325452 RepID=A0A922APY5_9STRA|nr:hypothetical protein G195_004848 [Phytophthora kernoviae 00238/432]KAG2527644.1 hypothetical protein JM18_003607 [Phytophthora kernoviae]